ncbi:hypothetical protein PIB30_087003, partial [Stylosanthes scabra]|nr:hypothetical protein [Stylosanthes scabra]
MSKSEGTSSSSNNGLEMTRVHEELAENKATISLLQAQVARSEAPVQQDHLLLLAMNHNKMNLPTLDESYDSKN